MSFMVSGKVFCFFLIGVLAILSGLNIYNSISTTDDFSYLEPNYEGLIELGLIPNTDARYATEKDTDTKLRGVYNGQLFGMFESRTWETGDYGKTFLSPVSN